MHNSDTNEFYIGYAPRPPRGIARTIFRAVIALNVFGAAVAGLLVFAQQPFERSVFEFQQYRNFTGMMEMKPYPALMVEHPGDKEYSRYLLVAPGKHGAKVGSFEGKTVGLRGSLIYRGGQTMLEVAPGSVREQPGVPVEVADVNLGEIVDSKCYLGVMNPVQTKVHRDCAARCISGGIPPALVTSDGLYLLVGGDGRPLRSEVLEWVGETIEVRGDVRRSGESLILRAEPADFRRVSH